MDLPAPVNGLKLMAFTVVVFALAAGYGQWQHVRRGQVEKALVVPLPNESPTPTPHRP